MKNLIILLQLRFLIKTYVKHINGIVFPNFLEPIQHKATLLTDREMIKSRLRKNHPHKFIPRNYRVGGARCELDVEFSDLLRLNTSRPRPTRTE